MRRLELPEVLGREVRNHAEWAARYSHPNLARVYDCEIGDEGVFWVTSFSSGATLAEVAALMRRQGQVRHLQARPLRPQAPDGGPAVKKKETDSDFDVDEDLDISDLGEDDDLSTALAAAEAVAAAKPVAAPQIKPVTGLVPAIMPVTPPGGVAPASAALKPLTPPIPVTPAGGVKPLTPPIPVTPAGGVKPAGPPKISAPLATGVNGVLPCPAARSAAAHRAARSCGSHGPGRWCARRRSARCGRWRCGGAPPR